MTTIRAIILLASTYLFTVSPMNLLFGQDTAVFRRDKVIVDSTFYVDIGPSLPHVLCHALIFVLATPDDSREPTVYKFDFSTSAFPNHRFSVVDTTQWGSGHFRFSDLNFDGFKDLQYDWDMDKYANYAYAFWLFDPDSLLYRPWEGFAEEAGDGEPDPANKTISFSGWSFYATERATWTHVYKFLGVNAFKVEDEARSDFSDQADFGAPDSTVETIDAYKYDLIDAKPLVVEHVHTIILTKQATEFITTILKKRIGNQMVVAGETHEVKKAE
jgi:hypothetical protein